MQINLTSMIFGAGSYKKIMRSEIRPKGKFPSPPMPSKPIPGYSISPKAEDINTNISIDTSIIAGNEGNF